MKRAMVYIAGGTAVIWGIYLLCLAVPRPLFFKYADEGAFGEWIGAIGLLVGSLLSLWLYFRSRGIPHRFLGRRMQSNLYFLLLAILLFVAFGEEISWGQRLFGLYVPEAWQKINAQKELNLHNLWIFQAYNPDGTQKSFWQRLFTPNRLFSIFWFLFCLIVPVADRLWGAAHRFFHKMGLPIGPIWIGVLFFVNFLLFHLMIVGLDAETIAYMDEVKEAIMELLFGTLALWFSYREVTGVRGRSGF